MILRAWLHRLRDRWLAWQGRGTMMDLIERDGKMELYDIHPESESQIVTDLRAQLADSRSGMAEANKRWLEARAALAEAKADAERWRFVRQFAGSDEKTDWPEPKTPEEADKIVDAARAKGPQK